MPYNAISRTGGTGRAEIPSKSPLRNVIVHYDPPGADGGKARSITLEFANNPDMSSAWTAAVEKWSGEAFGLCDTVKGGKPSGLHEILHADMCQALRVDMNGSLCTIHQHWVAKGTESIGFDDVAGLLAALLKERLLAKGNQEHLMANVR